MSSHMRRRIHVKSYDYIKPLDGVLFRKRMRKCKLLALGFRV